RCFWRSFTPRSNGAGTRRRRSRSCRPAGRRNTAARSIRPAAWKSFGGFMPRAILRACKCHRSPEGQLASTGEPFMKRLLCTLLAAGLFPLVRVAQEAVEGVYPRLFNGKDLTGWEYGPVPVTKKPIIEKLDGKTATKDQVFAVHEGV